MQELIGRKIHKVLIGENGVSFETDKGPVHYVPDGDCCSRTYIHDFIGVKNLIDNGPVEAVEEIPVEKTHTEREKENDVEETTWYGYRIVTTGEFGHMSSVLSFRNESNGYYGGRLESAQEPNEGIKEISSDWIAD